MDLSLVLPTYNEQANIVSVIADAETELVKLGRTWEILVVDNFSQDQTVEIVETYAKTHPNIRIVGHRENRLYSGSCQTAIEEARGQYVAIMDSDGQYASADIKRFLDKMGDANLVFGWRKNRKDPVARLLMSKVFNRLGTFRIRFPFHDLNCGFRMFDREFIKHVKLTHRINMSNPEIYVRAKLAGLRMDELEVAHFNREQGASSHNFFRLWQLFSEVNQYFKSLGADLKSNLKG
ncbi:MAG: glycosyltransferase involved in cell wall biosynthesis [Candidatus Marinamargulisbacteria bacterium]|jgi:glycosyltransferase involved in cell wall biosynthesis